MTLTTVLVVDDDADFRALLRMHCEHHGLQVVEAPGGHEALHEVARRPAPFDLVLSDLSMPVMDGLELRERLASDHPQLRVTVWTSLSRRPDGVLRKGLDVLDALLGRRESHDAAH